jgi:hypothetical protein
MAVIGGRVGPAKNKNYQYKIVLTNDKGEKTNLNFFTIRHARNWIREHGSHHIFSITDLRNGSAVAL